ncbi:MAG TPA: hypothetical protein VF621_09280, partial [Pyrinomonadaceae bacterium]
DTEPGLLHAYWMMKEYFSLGKRPSHDLFGVANMAEEFGLVVWNPSSKVFDLSSTGRQFLLRLRIERNTDEAEQYVLEP